MGKKDNAVYAPGELSRVRDKLGPLDLEEAKQLANKLGGEVGFERSEYEENSRRARQEKVEVQIKGRKAKRRIDLAFNDAIDLEENDKKKTGRKENLNPADDPLVPLKASYWERIKMDRYASQPEFEIKSPGQVFQSMISVFSEAADYVNPAFVTHRMAEYYKKIEVLVTSTRSMLPRNNIKRTETMKKSAPLAFSVIDLIRYWDIEKISGELSRIQARPRNATVNDFTDILRAVYKPLFLLGKLNLDAHIRGAYKILYKLLYIENPGDAKSKYQDLIRTALTAFSGVQKDIHYLLFPLLLKAVSSSFVPYEDFFTERKNRLMSFLNVRESDQLDPGTMGMQEDSRDLKAGEQSQDEDSSASQENPKKDADQAKEEEKVSEAEKERRAIEESEKKAFDRGINTLEMLFPKAGWDRASTYPDFYPYYADIFNLKKGAVNIAPTDPLQQVYILMRCLEELFFGLRHASFTTIISTGSGATERIDSALGEIVNEWHYLIELCFEKEYLTRMTEYIRILEGSIEERNSQYAKKIITEMHWIKRYYLLPFYKFDSLMPSPMQKKDTVPIYIKIKTLRKYLAAVAAGIEQGNKAGGASANAPCDGIDNPWAPYVFQVPNPLSIRLNALLSPKAKHNASLIYFCLAITSVLDHLVNSETSWAYTSKPGPLFRSENGEGNVPLTGVDQRIDADALFKKALKARQNKSQ